MGRSVRTILNTTCLTGKDAEPQRTGGASPLRLRVSATPFYSLRARQAGLSLIELMVALTVGLLLLAGLVTVVVSTSRSYEELSRVSRQLENGRYAFQILKDEIQHAGFYGAYDSPPPPATLPASCSTAAADLQAALSLPLQGYDNPATVSGVLPCLSDADHLDGTDVLVVRRAATSAVAPGSLEANRVYLQGIGPMVRVATEDGDTSNDLATFDLTWREPNPAPPPVSVTAPAPIFPYTLHIYFVSPCSRPAGTQCDANADGGSPIPTLKRLELAAGGGGPVMTVVPLVEGIEDLQFDYGIDADGDGSPNGAYVTAPATALDWSNVVSIRASLLARNPEPTVGHTDTKSYALGLTAVGPFNDRFKRHVYSAVVRAVNPSSRRE